MSRFAVNRCVVKKIQNSGLSIYDSIERNRELWIPDKDLEVILDSKLRNLDVSGLPNRTRSKFVKEAICKALGYPVPSSFKKAHPRFTGQNFDVYNQKSNNLQVWGEEIEPTRRYVMIRISESDIVQKIKVVRGDVLAALDTTGTLTTKYQAKLKGTHKTCELVSSEDTGILKPYLAQNSLFFQTVSPAAIPASGSILPIQTLYAKLQTLIGKQFADGGASQDRNRGADLQRLVCSTLGYTRYEDNGQLPDLLHQLLEVKLQTAPTIDLGKILPTCTDKMPKNQVDELQVRYCDIRYAVFYGKTDGQIIKLTNFYLTCGIDFFDRFQQFQGNVQNRKIQIPLPVDFFD